LRVDSESEGIALYSLILPDWILLPSTMFTLFFK